MAEPFEIIAAPLELYLAEADTPAPEIDDDEAALITAGWALVGKSGSRNYGDDGVTVTHEQEITGFTPAGATVPRKYWRTSENLEIGVAIADLTVEAYALALNNAQITTVPAAAGVAGKKSIQLFQGDQVATHALLARGLSPYADGMFAHYYVPRCAQGADSIEITYNKGEPALLELTFRVMSGDTGDFGLYEAGTAPATP